MNNIWTWRRVAESPYKGRDRRNWRLISPFGGTQVHIGAFGWGTEQYELRHAYRETPRAVRRITVFEMF